MFDLRQELDSPATESVWEEGSDKKKRILADHELTNLEMVNRWLHMIAMVKNAVLRSESPQVASCEMLLEVSHLGILLTAGTRQSQLSLTSTDKWFSHWI